LKHMDSRKLDAIVDPAIGTAEGILALAKRNPEAVSLILGGTAGKYLSDAMGKVAGYKGAPIRKMKNLLSKLCTPGMPYPYAELPPKGIDEQEIELAEEAIRLMSHLEGHEATTLARRTLALFHKTFTLLPPHAEKQMRILAKFVPNYVPPPDDINAHNMLQAHALMKMPSAG
jgi:hypothetical protein